MFKKNPNRPPITINLRKVSNGYKVISNDSYNPFSFKKITRAIFKNDLQNSKGPQAMNSGGIANSNMSQSLPHITMPLSAKWFDFDQIHHVEREAFPEFFLQDDQEGKLFRKSPRLYKLYRNFIVALWRENPKKYLSACICRKNLPGDVSAILRIHAFLEHWGLINFPSKEHAKGFMLQKSQQYFCHICEFNNASEYYVCKIDQETTFQICNCCYVGKIYPASLSNQHFSKIIPKVHKQGSRKKMNSQEIKKLLELVGSENSKEKEMWTSISQAFPNYSKEELILNFLLVPENHKMNANIFHNNEDAMEEEQPEEDPTIFQDYENQEQISIATSFYLWKTAPNQYPELQRVFEGAQEHSAYLARIQQQKATQMIRMLIDVQQSKLELKSIFIQELEKLTKAEEASLNVFATNMMAEELKNREFQPFF